MGLKSQKVESKDLQGVVQGHLKISLPLLLTYTFNKSSSFEEIMWSLWWNMPKKVYKLCCHCDTKRKITNKKSLMMDFAPFQIKGIEETELFIDNNWSLLHAFVHKPIH